MLSRLPPIITGTISFVLLAWNEPLQLHMQKEWDLGLFLRRGGMRDYSLLTGYLHYLHSFISNN